MDPDTQANATPLTDAAAAPATCKARCISELRPWATVIDSDGNTVSRPLDIDEVVTIPAAEGQVLQNHRHAVIVG